MPEPLILPAERFSLLLEALRRDGYELLGPTVRDGAIVLTGIEGPNDLPAGWTARQAPGEYRLERRTDGAFFGHAVSQHSWKSTFFPQSLLLWRAERRADGFAVAAPAPEISRRVALIGARACDLAALAVQDRVFLEGAFRDPDYARRRADVFVVALQCGVAGGNCFCVSLGTGPRAERGFDLALTELLDGDAHRFLVQIGSDRGARIAEGLGADPADPADIARAEAVVAATAARMGRVMDASGIRDLLAANLEHPRWDDVAARCLGCTNCTLVCPTCFCAQVEDGTDLPGDHAWRVRVWDSCFTLGHSQIHGLPVRGSIRSRYRQWLTHKLGTWIDQYGTSGCVGCGRCITWCPAGIDITEEVRAIRGG